MSKVPHFKHRIQSHRVIARFFKKLLKIKRCDFNVEVEAIGWLEHINALILRFFMPRPTGWPIIFIC